MVLEACRWRPGQLPEAYRKRLLCRSPPEPHPTTPDQFAEASALSLVGEAEDVWLELPGDGSTRSSNRAEALRVSEAE